MVDMTDAFIAPSIVPDFEGTQTGFGNLAPHGIVKLVI